MPQPENFPPPFRLGPWLVQPDLNRIAGPEGAQQVEPRVMKVLLCLAEEPGRVWTRLELLDRVWGDAVVGEEILTRAVSELRRVFGDQARQPEYIETIRSHGYRLIAAVEPAPEAVEPACASAPDAAPDPAPDPTPDAASDAASDPVVEPAPALGPAPAPASAAPAAAPGRRRLWPLAVTILAILAGIALLGPLVRGGRHRPPETTPVGVGAPAVPLTSFPGREWHPALSPDGTRVAFVRREPGAASSDIYLKQRSAETVLRLTDDAAWNAWPAWSPDGQNIAYVAGGQEGAAIWTVPALGGPPRRLLAMASFVEGLDWAPDGGSLAYAARDSAGGDFRLFRLDLHDLTVRSLPAAAPDAAGDFQPRFSPDGRRLAWQGVDQAGISHLFVGERDGSAARRVTVGLTGVQGLAWTADGAALVYAASPGGNFSLWQAAVGGPGDPLGTPRQIATPGEFAWNPTIARLTGDLAFEQVQVDQDLWRVRVLSRDPWQLETAPFLQSTRWEFEGCYSPDGRQVAFVSARSGSPELWLADAQGGNLQQLTRLQLAGLANVSWDPEGRRLAFNAVVEGRLVIMVMEVDGAIPRQLTPGRRQEICSGWAHDGQSVLFGFEGGQGWDVYRRSPRGGAAQPVTRGGGITAREAADGGFLYFTRPGCAGLWRAPLVDGAVPADAGDPQPFIAELAGQDRRNWLLGPQEILWVIRSGGVPILARRDLAGGPDAFITELSRWSGAGLGASPDGDAVIFPRTGDITGDLLLLPAAGNP